MTQNPSTPIALTIAGSDSGGGAGIQADLKTFSALGVYGASVITALTAQNTQTVSAIYDVTPEFIGQQINAVCSDLSVSAVKIGMLSQPTVIESIATGLLKHKLECIVLDPVMVAKSGDKLLQDDAVDALRNTLIPQAKLITPNLPEACVLLNIDSINANDMEDAAHELLKLGCKAVLLKGGHLQNEQSMDLLVTGDNVTRLDAKRIATQNTHGTGCTLSSAITAYLARGLTLSDAVKQAKEYINNAIAHADELSIGHGHGPVHHFYQYWK
ncbi:MAG: bifunctional hydroxymethylpyrimidine kinase/phosphomethylpyrimidine kinase [Gammaproteobacteria bacterium]|nr:bifunctional hydroxymethylpyrimidine kinase/phosphomethylpyrimidine kinase [Gammaproteobacteria bacterium]